MASTLGVSPSTVHIPGGHSPDDLTRQSFNKSQQTIAGSGGSSCSSSAVPSQYQQTHPSKYPKPLSSRVVVTSKRVRAESSPSQAISIDSSTPLPPGSTSATPARVVSSPVLGSTDARDTGTARLRPKHIPIVIPEYEILTNPTTASRSGSFSSWLSNEGVPLTASEFLASISQRSFDSSPPRHVEIQIPSFAQPVLKQCSSTSPRVSSTSTGPTASGDRAKVVDRRDSMDSKTPVVASNQGKAANGSFQSYYTTANSSQSSLGSHQEDYESTSEVESGYEDDAGSHVASQTTGAAHPGHSHTTSTPLTSNIAGLACTTHRTTGQEPHPLVGATTTILGDKLYVFGGRRLSRMKPQLTSNLYELDLLKRHWTKLETSGDIPPPRYFHSVCALGDTKLVCYGGMSPSPAAVESNGEAPPEVIVMSDIHIFDVPTKTWMKINTPDPPQGRYAHCAAILPSSAVFASASAPLSGIHHNLPGGNPHQGSLGVTLDGAGGAEMVVVGGQDSANHYIEQVSVFNLRSLKWTGTTSMGRSCGAYRSVVTPLTTLSASQIGGGPHAKNELDEDDDEPATIGSGSPMLIYSNYNFLDVKLELQVRLPDGTLTEKKMQTNVSPPGLRFPNGGVLANHFVVSGTFLTSSKQEYALWALDLRTLTWSRVDVGGGIFSRGSWNRGVLWSRRNTFVILGNRKRSLVDDYNNRRINFSNLCLVELEIFGMYDNPRRTSPMSGFVSGSTPFSPEESSVCAVGRTLSPAAEDLGLASMNVSELADMDFLAIDGTRIAVNSRLIARRWGPHFTNLLKESLAMSNETDTATLRPSVSGHPSRNSIVTITPSVTSTNTTLTANSASEVFDPRSAPPMSRPRLFYLPHTAPTLQALLHYLYTSTLPAAGNPLATPQIFCSLLQLARPYKIDGLLEATLERLHEFLDGANAVALFNAAAMGAGGGEGVQFAPSSATFRDSAIPLRGASLDATSIVNGGSTSSNNSSRATSALRIDTDMANGRSTRNTLRPHAPFGQSAALSEDSDDEVPDSANTDTSLSDFESSSRGGLLSARTERQSEIWRGTLSAVVGLQKRGLRGLMEGRRIRERGVHEGKVGLGIA